MFRIESLLSARLFLQPKTIDNRIYFVSNLSGRLSLYAMDYGGSVPEPLLPPNIALQNPHLLDGEAYSIFNKLDKIVVMIDKNGDENYQPMLIPLSGGFPETTFNNFFSNFRVHLAHSEQAHNLLYFEAESRQDQTIEAYLGFLESGELLKLGESPWGCAPIAYNQDHTKVVLMDHFTQGDTVLYLWTKESGERHLLFGTPIEARKQSQDIPLSNFFTGHFVANDRALLIGTALFNDTNGLGLIHLDHPGEITPITVNGTQHQGLGELIAIRHLVDNHFMLEYNIDGCSWVYGGSFDEDNCQMNLERVLCGIGTLQNGVVESIDYNAAGDLFTLAFSSAISPTQIYTIEGKDRKSILRHTNENILGISSASLSSGEDCSFNSFDGTRISARLYLPLDRTRYSGPWPLIYYIHGGPQSQERPDFAWFSMPLIQLLILNGFAVFVPNVRGSSGYGLNYTKQVDRDWGGKDRLDHVHAMTSVLINDHRLDMKRAGVVGRSYGGYMTLTLAGRHPDLWSAAVDMFGPFDLHTFLQRIPPTWKPYYRLELGDPDLASDREFLEERSPRTYLHDLACPLLVIQGKNDPRVVERESRDLVENLRSNGKDVSYLMFEDEGHDVLKYENRVTCYNTITDFFIKTLKP